MKKNILLLVMCCLVSLIQAQQPYAGCYHPEDLKNWVPGENPNDVFNRGTIALQPRFVDETIKANPNASFSNAMVAPDLTLTKDCSKGYAQGRNTFDEMYIFNYWQYVDMVIWWGGSAGEGVFVCPTASAIDAAHKNGVKILGNIFFAPGAFGGQSAWVTQTLEKDGEGNYIIADKLIELANYFGFDGWFLNEETNHFYEKDEWTKFCAYYSANSDLELQMYNASSSFSASNGWMLRNGDGETTGTSYFVNYGGTYGVDTHTSYAESIGAQPWDLYYGINQGTSAFANNFGIAQILPKDNHKASLALFLERATWRQGNSNDQYNLDESYIHNFFRYSTKYWVGTEEGTVDEDRASQAWSGIANYIPARTHIEAKPFVTNFNSGYGVRRNIKGVDKGVSGQKWVHQGIQDVLPTWRWWWQDAASKELSCDLTLEDAYEGGTSIKVTGNLNANDANEIRLFKTKLAIDNGDVFKLVFKNSTAGASNIKVGLAFTEDNNAFTYLDAGEATGSWDVKEIDLSAYAGKTLSMISLKYESTAAISNFTSYIGQMGVLGVGSLSCSAVTNLAVQQELGLEKGDMRLAWSAATGDIQHYNVYLEQNGTRSLVGQTPSCAYYIADIIRTSSSELGVKVYVTSVTKDFEESAETSLNVNWQEISSPEVKIKTTSSFSKAIQEITFTAVATNYPESYTWTMPAGAVKVSESEDKSQVIYKFPNEGVYDIKVAVANATGTTDFTAEGLVTINNTDELSNVALNKTIVDHNGHFGTEQPEKLVDGITDQGGSAKWCFGGEKEHFVVIDLEESYQIYRTRLYDCKVNEDADNLKTYRAFVSVDNTEDSWVEIFDEEGREADNIKDDHFAGIIGRYVKLVPYDVNDAITIRLWEFEVYGLAGSLSIDPSSDVQLDIQESKSLTVGFDLGGENKASNFNVEVIKKNANNDVFDVSNVVTSDNNVSFQIKGNVHGSGTAIVKVTNGEWIVTSTVNITVLDPNWLNFLPLATETKALAIRVADGSVYSDHSGEVNKALDGAIDGEFIDYQYTYDVEPVYFTTEFSFDKTYNLKQLEFWFNFGMYATFPNKIKLLSSEDGTNWNTEGEMTPDQLQVVWELSDIVTSNNFKIEMYYNDGYNDECELLEIRGIGGEESTATAIGGNDSHSFKASVNSNPLTETSEIEIYMPQTGTADVVVYNIAGSKIAALNSGVLREGRHTIAIGELNYAAMKAGVYIIVVNSEFGHEAIKVIKR